MKQLNFKNWQMISIFIIITLGVILLIYLILFSFTSNVVDPIWIQAIGSLFLLLVTALYVVSTNKLVKFQIDQGRTEKLSKEMDYVVSPLYINMNNGLLFGQYARWQGIGDKRNEDNYDKFWDGIKRNLYLCPQNLRDPIHGYIHLNKTDQKTNDEEYEKIEKKLFIAIESRYLEILNELSGLYGEI
jgi:hypothetical protein